MTYVVIPAGSAICNAASYNASMEARVLDGGLLLPIPPGLFIEWRLDGAVVKSGNTSNQADAFMSGLSKKNAGSVVDYVVGGLVVSRPLKLVDIAHTLSGVIQADAFNRCPSRPVLDWEYMDPEGEEQSWYRVFIGTAPGLSDLYDTGVRTSNTKQWRCDAEIRSGPIFWGLEAGDELSRADTSGICIVNTPPTVAITSVSPQESGRPMVEWSYSDSDGHPQKTYQVTIKASGSTLWDSGKRTSSASRVRCPDLPPGVAVSIVVEVGDGFGLGSSTAEFTYLPVPRITSVLVEGMVLPRSAPPRRPTVSWTCEDADQVAFEMVVMDGSGLDSKAIWSSGEIRSSEHRARCCDVEAGKSYSVRVRVAGSHGWSKWATSSFVANQRPEARGLVVLPESPCYKSNLRAHYEFYDAGGDAESGWTILRWFLDSRERLDLRGVREVPSRLLSPGQKWSFSVRPHDGSEYGEEVTSTAAIVVNLPPKLTWFGVAPATPSTADDLVAAYTAVDPEGEDVSVHVKWYKNGVEQQSLDGMKSVPAALLAAGDSWHFAAVPFDGHDHGTCYTSKSVDVSPARPVVRTMLVNGLEAPSEIKTRRPVVSWDLQSHDGRPQTKFRIIIGTRPLATGRYGSDVKSGAEVFDSGVVDSGVSIFCYSAKSDPSVILDPFEFLAKGFASGPCPVLQARAGKLQMAFPGQPGEYDVLIDYDTPSAAGVVYFVVGDKEVFSSKISGKGRVVAPGVKLKKGDPVEVRVQGSGTAISGVRMDPSASHMARCVLVPGMTYYASVQACDGAAWSEWRTTKFKMAGCAWSGVENSVGWAIEFSARATSGGLVSVNVSDGSRAIRLSLLDGMVAVESVEGMEFMLDTSEWHVYRICGKGADARLYVDGKIALDCKGLMEEKVSTRVIEFGSRNGALSEWGFLRYCVDGDRGPGSTDVEATEVGRFDGFSSRSMVPSENGLLVGMNPTGDGSPVVYSYSEKPASKRVMAPLHADAVTSLVAAKNLFVAGTRCGVFEVRGSEHDAPIAVFCADKASGWEENGDKSLRQDSKGGVLLSGSDGKSLFFSKRAEVPSGWTMACRVGGVCGDGVRVRIADGSSMVELGISETGLVSAGGTMVPTPSGLDDFEIKFSFLDGMASVFLRRVDGEWGMLYAGAWDSAPSSLPPGVSFGVQPGSGSVRVMMMGLFSWSPGPATASEVKVSNGATAFLRTNHVSVSGQGFLVATDAGVFRTTPEESMFLGRRADLVVGTSSGAWVAGDGGLWLCTPSDSKMMVAMDELSCMVPDSGGGVVVGSPNGLLFVDKTGKIVRRIGVREGLPSDWVTALCQDDAGLLVGTNAGAARIASGFSVAEPIPVRGRISGVHKTHGGAVFVSGQNAFLWDGGSARHLCVIPGPFYCSCLDSRGLLWVGGDGRIHCPQASQRVNLCEFSGPARYRMRSSEGSPVDFLVDGRKHCGFSMNGPCEVSGPRTASRPIAACNDSWTLLCELPSGAVIVGMEQAPGGGAVVGCSGAEGGVFLVGRPSDGLEVVVDDSEPDGVFDILHSGGGSVSLSSHVSDKHSSVVGMQFSTSEGFEEACSTPMLPYAKEAVVPIPGLAGGGLSFLFKSSEAVSCAASMGSRIFCGTKSGKVVDDSGAVVLDTMSECVTCMSVMSGKIVVGTRPAMVFVDGRRVDVKADAVLCMTQADGKAYVGCAPASVFSIDLASLEVKKVFSSGGGFIPAICAHGNKIVWSEGTSTLPPGCLMSTTESRGHKHDILSPVGVVSVEGLCCNTSTSDGHFHDVVNGMVVDEAGHGHEVVSPGGGRLCEHDRSTGGVREFYKSESGYVTALLSVSRPETRSVVSKATKGKPAQPATRVEVPRNVLLAGWSFDGRVSGFSEDLSTEWKDFQDSACRVSCLSMIGGQPMAMAGRLAWRFSGSSWVVSETLGARGVGIVETTGGPGFVTSGGVLAKAGDSPVFARFVDEAGNMSRAMKSSRSLRDVGGSARSLTGGVVHDIGYSNTVSSIQTGDFNPNSHTEEEGSVFSAERIVKETGIYYSEVFDGTAALVQWEQISWVSTESPPAYYIDIYVRTSDSQAALEQTTWGDPLGISPQSLTGYIGQFLQFKAELIITSGSTSPHLDTVEIDLKTAQATHFFTKNFDLPAKARKGIITYNGTSSPPDTDLVFGISGKSQSSPDFTDFFVVTPNRVFELPSAHRTQDLRVGIKFISSPTTVAVVDEFSLLFSMDGGAYIQLNAAGEPTGGTGSTSTGATRTIVTEVVEGHSHTIVVPSSLSNISLFSGETSVNAGHKHVITNGVLSTTAGHTHTWSLD